MREEDSGRIANGMIVNEACDDVGILTGIRTVRDVIDKPSCVPEAVRMFLSSRSIVSKVKRRP